MNKKSIAWECGIFAFFLIASIFLTWRACIFAPGGTMVTMADPATFYMCGKAWASGLTPYVDFIDVKGPLLMFIYMVGYLLSPGEPTGIFFIYCLALACTLHTLYRIAGLFVPSRPLSVLASLLACFVIFREEPLVGGAQAEMLMLPLAAWLLHAILNIERQEAASDADWVKAAFALGIGGAACFLIKFNMAAPYALAAGGCLLALLARKAPFSLHLRFWPALFAGLALVFLPFVIYMRITGSLQACFDRYVMLNIMTYTAGGGDASFGSMVAPGVTGKILFAISAMKMSWPAVAGLFCLALPPFSRYGEKRTRIPWLAMLVVAGVYVSSLGYHECYHITPAVAFIFPLILFVRALLWPVSCPPFLIYGAILLSLFTASVLGNKVRRDISRIQSSPQFQKLDALIDARPGVKILYLDSLELGFGMKNALPACPMWVLHNRGPEWTQEMQRDAIRQRKADLVLFNEKRPNTDPERDKALLEERGYEKITGVIEGEPKLETYSLWRRAGDR